MSLAEVRPSSARPLNSRARPFSSRLREKNDSLESVSSGVHIPNAGNHNMPFLKPSKRQQFLEQQASKENIANTPSPGEKLYGRRASTAVPQSRPAYGGSPFADRTGQIHNVNSFMSNTSEELAWPSVYQDNVEQRKVTWQQPKAEEEKAKPKPRLNDTDGRRRGSVYHEDSSSLLAEDEFGVPRWQRDNAKIVDRNFRVQVNATDSFLNEYNYRHSDTTPPANKKKLGYHMLDIQPIMSLSSRPSSATHLDPLANEAERKAQRRKAVTEMEENKKKLEKMKLSRPRTGKNAVIEGFKDSPTNENTPPQNRSKDRRMSMPLSIEVMVEAREQENNDSIPSQLPKFEVEGDPRKKEEKSKAERRKTIAATMMNAFRRTSSTNEIKPDALGGDAWGNLLSSIKNLTMYSWGRGLEGQLGLEIRNSVAFPTVVTAFLQNRVKKIACGGAHTLVLTEDGELYSWGSNKHGQLGHRTLADEEGEHGQETPTLIDRVDKQDITEIACGESHCVICTDGGEVVAWGKNDHGQLGLGDTKDRNFPYVLTELLDINVVGVACGEAHTLLVSDIGDIYSCGRGEEGQLGHDDVKDRHEPTHVQEFQRCFSSVCAAGHHSVAISTDGELYTWGWGMHGQLGHGDQYDQRTPRMVVELQRKGVKSVACGSFHTLGLTDNGHVYLMTTQGTIHQHRKPPVESLYPRFISIEGHRIREVACGDNCVLAITESGSTYQGIFKANTNLTFSVLEGLEDKQVYKIAAGWRHFVCLAKLKRGKSAHATGLRNAAVSSNLCSVEQYDD